MKIGLSSYSFFNLVNSGQMAQIDVIARAKEMGFDFVEFSKFILPAGVTLLEFAHLVREECDRVGMKVVNYAISADFTNAPGGDWRNEAERLKEEVQVARIIGAPGMRHDVSWGYKPDYQGPRGFNDALPVIVKGCRAVTEYAQEFGIKTMVENHGFFCQDSERVEKLVNGVNHPNFGALVDIGNFLCVDEDAGKAVGRLMPYAFHVHVKNFHSKPGDGMNPGEGWTVTRGGNYLRGAIIGHGNVPVLQCLNVMKRAGYDGLMCIEFEGMEDPYKGISIGYNNLCEYIKYTGGCKV